MESSKNILSILAVILTFIGYVPYIRSIIQKKTKPHIYSWFVWTLDGFIIFGLQITHGAGPSSFVAFSAGLLALTVILLTIVHKGKSDITLTDTMFTILALLALGIWLIAKQPLLSAVLIMLVDVLGFVPTIRKSWWKPYSENATFYIVNSIRFCIALFALKEYSIITVLYPGIWFLGNVLFTGMLFSRRKIHSIKPHK